MSREDGLPPRWYVIGVWLFFSLAILALLFPFAPTRDECTQTWTINDGITIDQIEKFIDNGYILVTQDNKLEKLYVGNLEIKFQDVDVPRIEKWEKYKKYNIPILSKLESRHDVRYYLVLPEEYKEKLKIWYEERKER